MHLQKQPLPQPQRFLLLQKYNAMNVSELKNQRMEIVKQLEQLNYLASQLVQNVGHQITKNNDLDSQIQMEKKVGKALIKSYQNFEFMLSGNYGIRIEEELQKIKIKIKKAKNQVNRLKRQLSTPKQNQQEIHEDFQAQIIKLNIEIQEGKARIVERQKNFMNLITQNNFKAAEIHRMTKNIKKYNEIIEKDEQNKNEKYIKNPQQYEKLITKRNKLSKMIQNSNRKGSLELKQKYKQYEKLDSQKKQIKRQIKQLNKAIEMKEEEIKQLETKNKMAKSRSKRINSEGCYSHEKKKKRQSLDKVFNTSFIIQRQRKASRIRDFNIKKESQDKSEDFMDKKIYDQRKSENLLPMIYKILGKNKSLIEEEEDLKDLIYH